MSRRARTRIKPGYVWGSLCNVEPPDEAEEIELPDTFDMDDFEPAGPDEYAAAAAADRYQQDINA